MRGYGVHRPGRGKGFCVLGGPRGLGLLLTLQECVKATPHPGLGERGEEGPRVFMLKKNLALGGAVLDSKS